MNKIWRIKCIKIILPSSHKFSLPRQSIQLTFAYCPASDFTKLHNIDEKQLFHYFVLVSRSDLTLRLISVPDLESKFFDLIENFLAGFDDRSKVAFNCFLCYFVFGFYLFYLRVILVLQNAQSSPHLCFDNY